MKKLIVLSLSALISVGCNQAANTNQTVQKANDQSVVSSHSDVQRGDSTQAGKGNSTESPNAKAVDVSEMTDEIERTEKEYKKNPKEKEVLANAYFRRAFQLTEAAQYRAALGDFRKGLKLNPNDADAKAMHDQIIQIFKSMGREPPKEGEEPPPLPFGK